MYGGTDEAERELAVRCQHERAAHETVSRQLADRGLASSVIEAQAVSIRLDQLEKLERIIASIESRRDRALLKISDYRLYLASSLRRTEARLLEAESATGGRGEIGPGFSEAAE